MNTERLIMAKTNITRKNKTKKVKLKKNLNITDGPFDDLPKIQDCLTEGMKNRIKPLLWLINREDYTTSEIMTAKLMYEQSPARRAKAILELIKSRQDDARKKNKK